MQGVFGFFGSVVSESGCSDPCMHLRCHPCSVEVWVVLYLFEVGNACFWLFDGLIVGQ